MHSCYTFIPSHSSVTKCQLQILPSSYHTLDFKYSRFPSPPPLPHQKNFITSKYTYTHILGNISNGIARLPGAHHHTQTFATLYYSQLQYSTPCFPWVEVSKVNIMLHNPIVSTHRVFMQEQERLGRGRRDRSRYRHAGLRRKNEPWNKSGFKD